MIFQKIMILGDFSGILEKNFFSRKKNFFFQSDVIFFQDELRKTIDHRECAELSELSIARGFGAF